MENTTFDFEDEWAELWLLYMIIIKFFERFLSNISHTYTIPANYKYSFGHI